ncbi:hypothetical protein ACLK19_17245 [Escherichia coli]
MLGVWASPDIASLPFTPDLAVLCTNASRNLALWKSLARKAVKPALFFPPGIATRKYPRLRPAP